ncbi:short-chain dehydrogenase/reductase SDR [Fictibacillus macauensis ZFHKF-1]|uniref:Short-chain dehydrogenase/reductase SDR n=1 Tax=Fictibacillus macauensis ZFHKF-1 TaxID=1196324 RepID=I8AK16_9BACL|nr:SDR family NAD(P)-dependent oxidoreductase [Fictibacillus macauensis]EIT86157.1 short-chain dehydrogenase/reductase SDR [Fictibacillus macauensis ZFHKF-1]
MLLQDKVVLIYGGSGAIGRSIALAVAKAGASEYVGGRTQAPLEEVAHHIKKKWKARNNGRCGCPRRRTCTSHHPTDCRRSRWY